jgi:ADP-ribosylglycohydrolase
MIGAIAGDIIGSVYEFDPIKTKDFALFSPGCRFTDDSVLTVAVAEAIMKDEDYSHAMRKIGRDYPDRSYGQHFYYWLMEDHAGPYNSFGNGSAMRVSPVGFAYDDEDSVLREAARTAEVSHNHPEGVKGAQATALAIFLARCGSSKDSIKSEIGGRFGYDLGRTLESIRPVYDFDVSCQGTVPEAVISFLESTSYEDAVRNAVSLGGDSDTLACITGGIAQAYYGGVPAGVLEKVKEILAPYLWKIVEEFCTQYQVAMVTPEG